MVYFVTTNECKSKEEVKNKIKRKCKKSQEFVKKRYKEKEVSIRKEERSSAGEFELMFKMRRKKKNGFLFRFHPITSPSQF
jgi:DNA polymerase II small subunit/DNA polymerase delta subunit B